MSDQTAKFDVQELVERYSDVLYRNALLRVRLPQVAQDIVQDTFLAAMQSASKFEGRSSVQTWLLAILKNKVLDYFRKSAREEISDFSSEGYPEEERTFNSFSQWRDDLAPWRGNPEESLSQSEFTKVLYDCLAKLPHRLREVLISRVADRDATLETCKKLGISASNVWVILHRSRLQVRECLDINWFKSAGRK